MDRGQAHAVEGLAAAGILLVSVIFALQVTAVTPLTGSTSSEHIENQQGAVADGVLEAAASNSSLKPSVLFWNGSLSEYHGADYLGAYTTGGPPTEFGRMLNETFRDRGIAFNVNLYYIDRNGKRRQLRMVNFGEPSTHALAGRHLVTLYDADRLYDEDGRTAIAIQNSSISFFAPDISSGSRIYNVIVVEVVVWRM